ncbi:MAG TPA: hydroxyethylthiazole kinase [Chthoniobacterales bacterium]|nr:hydroxyethylthiazole kinase [Chthoniobacterales bacterium]
MPSDIEISAYSIWTDLQKIREMVPLVYNITNSVVQDFTANALLALGASPIMSDSVEEAAELVEASDVLNINIGTPNEKSIAAMFEANKTAHKLGRPVALDPVAVGATRLRRKLIEDLLSSGTPTIVRGNLAEISVFAGLEWAGKGVDSSFDPGLPGEIVRAAAQKIGSVVVGTGKIDYASDGKRIISIANGHPFMTRVTGMGCVATSIIAAFLPVQPIALVAAVHAMAFTDIAGELAAEHSRTEGAGTFRVSFLDSFDKLGPRYLEAKMKVTVVAGG